MSAPRVELLWWQECPSWERALAMLREEVAAAGLDPEAIVVTEVTDDAQARARGFPGSPTILIDGADIQDPGHNPVGLSCRVYRRADGGISPLPERALIARALEKGAR